jgi:MFS family permease
MHWGDNMPLAAAERGRSRRGATRQRPPKGAAVRYLTAAGTSYFGDWLTTVALVVLLLRLTGSATAPALYILARLAPRVLGPPPGGTLADRYGPARVAALCALGQGVITASIVAFATLHVIWAVYFAVAVAQFLGSMAQPAYNAIIPCIVTRGQIGRINAANSSIQEACMLVAPGLGGLLLLAGVSPQLLIVGDAATFLIAATLLLTLRRLARGSIEPGQWRGMFAGMSLVRHDGMLRILAIGHLCNAFVVTVLQAVLVVAAAQRFGHDTAVGWLYAAVGAGGLVGSVTLLRWTPNVVRSAGITPAVFGELVPIGLFAVVPYFPVALLLLFVSALFAALYQTRGAIGLQQRVPTELLGRANAVIRLSVSVGMLIGAVLAASAVAWVSWDRLLEFASGGAAVVVILAVLTLPRELVTEAADTRFAGRLMRYNILDHSTRKPAAAKTTVSTLP